MTNTPSCTTNLKLGNYLKNTATNLCVGAFLIKTRLDTSTCILDCKLSFLRSQVQIMFAVDLSALTKEEDSCCSRHTASCFVFFLFLSLVRLPVHLKWWFKTPTLWLISFSTVDILAARKQPTGNYCGYFAKRISLFLIGKHAVWRWARFVFCKFSE